MRDHDHLPVAVLRIDDALKYGWTNDAWRTLTRSPQESIDAHALLASFHPADRDRVRSALHAALEERVAATLEVRANASDRWFEFRVAADGERGGGGLFVVLLDVTDVKAREKKLHFRATHDQLTGLFNRFALVDHLERSLARLQRTRSLLGLLLLDIDDFKCVNDLYGHVAGDRVLAVVAQRLLQTTRDSDILARFGGDEFVVLFEPSGSADRGCGLRQRVGLALEEPVRISRDVIVRQTISTGLAFTRDPKELPSNLLDRADRALLEAKRSKGSRRGEDPVVSEGP